MSNYSFKVQRWKLKNGAPSPQCTGLQFGGHTWPWTPGLTARPLWPTTWVTQKASVPFGHKQILVVKKKGRGICGWWKLFMFLFFQGQNNPLHPTPTLPATCQVITVPLCRDLLYTETVLPNILDHKTQVEAALEMHQFEAFVKVGCSPQLKPFLCSVYTPECVSGKPRPPCRTLCEQARSGCESLMSKLSVPWPEALRCEAFTTESCEHVSLFLTPTWRWTDVYEAYAYSCHFSCEQPSATLWKSSRLSENMSHYPLHALWQLDTSLTLLPSDEIKHLTNSFWVQPLGAPRSAWVNQRALGSSRALLCDIMPDKNYLQVSHRQIPDRQFIVA